MSQSDSTHSWPRITVVTPSYNQARFLERTLLSVLDQGYPNLEYLVYDAMSRDGSAEIIQKHAARLDYHEIAKDRGQSDAINKGFKRATGDVLCWLNSDDYFYPGALQKAGDFFRQNEQVVMLCGRIAIVDEQERFLREKKPPVLSIAQLLPWGGVPGQAAVFIRREVYEKLGGLREDLHFLLDWELWLRILTCYGAERIERVDEILAGAREWPQAKTESAAGRDAEESRRLLDEYFDKPELSSYLHMRPNAYARTWWKQAHSEANAGLKRRALGSLWKAARLSPMSFSVSKYLKLLWKIVFS